MHKTFCMFGFSLLCASLFVMLLPLKDDVINEYLASLNDEQVKAYLRIVKERKNIYIKGFILGSILALGYLLYSKEGKMKTDSFTRIAMFVGIAMLTQFLFYHLSSKKEWMLDYLTSQDQIHKWTQVYSIIQKKYYIGFLVGFVGYALIGRGMCI